jgi:hypothetical protein
MVKLDTGDDLYTGEGYTVIEALNDARVVSIDRLEDGRIAFAERCDDYFIAVLSQDQVRELARELIALIGEEP